jgi:transglutaminase-like putative cysteine protease
VSETNSSERTVGWILAGLLFLHLVLLRNSSPVFFATILLLAAGALLRSRQIFAPAWLERTMILGGVVVFLFLRQGMSFFQLPMLAGDLAGLAGAIFLLRPMTPARGLRVTFCVLALLVACVLRPYPGISATFLVIDIVALMIVAQQIHRPPEAAQSFWASLVRSLRVVVPVSIVVLLVFWLFPDYSLPPPAITGFAGSEALDPGRITKLSQSRRVALVAQFPDLETFPLAEQLYWRGMVLERNDGLRWLQDPVRRQPPVSLREPLPKGVPIWRYRQDIASSRGDVLPVLDRVIMVDARRDGQEIAVMNKGASVMTAGAGTGALRLEVTAAADFVSDPPLENVDAGATGVPAKIKENQEIKELVASILPPGLSTQQTMEAVATFLQKNGFSYTLRPGPIHDVRAFLLKKRSGFCEHYAAAAANLLRLGNVPARVVVGYRGGQWNPWSRTITVRDSDAHAWVEAWDPSSRRWLRFDPTDYVAPDIMGRMEREFDSGSWPWYRSASAYVSAFFTSIGDRIEHLLATAAASELWESLQPIFFVGLLLFLTAWLVRRIVLRQIQASRDIAASLLEDLDGRARRIGRQRRAGETPLAWLARLQREADAPEKETLQQFASAYNAGVYGPSGLTHAISNDLRSSARHLKRIWKSAGKLTTH